MIHVAIIDGSRVFADALAASLSVEPDIRVVRCATGRLALRQALDHSSADVVVCDDALFDDALFDTGSHSPVVGATPLQRVPLELVSGAGKQAHPRLAVVLLADHGDAARLAACLRWGVRGWVLRSNSIDDLLEAIRQADTGGTWIPPKELSRVLRELVWPSSADDPFQALTGRLTRRERDVLACLVEGLSRPEVATRLQLSTNTVRTHVQSILSKLGVNSCVAAVALVRRTSSTAPRVLALT
jgi:DNA-binding NarL/FixJ family response regulator